MNLLTDKIKPAFFKYFTAAFGGAFLSCIYGVVDTAVVGWYHGPDGTAAITVVLPVFNLIYAFGLLVGQGGAVLLANAKGKGSKTQPCEYFTLSVIGAVILSIFSWIVLFAFRDRLLYFFGADESLIDLARTYMTPLSFGAPVFIFAQMFSSLLRNDNAPGLVTVGVVVSGIFNVAGDFILVFGFNMGIKGAAIASVAGVSTSTLIMLTHFISKKNTLRLVRIKGIFKKARQIIANGFSTFFIDLALGIVTILFNRQIMKYMGTSALSVFGILMNINTLVQCCSYSIGEACQPIASINYGARQKDRVKESLKYSLFLCLGFGIFWLAVIEIFPVFFINLFMDATAEVLLIGPSIIRCYGIAFLFMPFTVFSTFYLQAVMRPAASFIVCVVRGFALSCVFIMLLPLVFSADAIWFSMPLTELLTAVLSAVLIIIYTRKI